MAERLCRFFDLLAPGPAQAPSNLRQNLCAEAQSRQPGRRSELLRPRCFLASFLGRCLGSVSGGLLRQIHRFVRLDVEECNQSAVPVPRAMPAKLILVPGTMAFDWSGRHRDPRRPVALFALHRRRIVEAGFRRLGAADDAIRFGPTRLARPAEGVASGRTSWRSSSPRPVSALASGPAAAPRAGASRRGLRAWPLPDRTCIRGFRVCVAKIAPAAMLSDSRRDRCKHGAHDLFSSKESIADEALLDQAVETAGLCRRSWARTNTGFLASGNPYNATKTASALVSVRSSPGFSACLRSDFRT